MGIRTSRLLAHLAMEISPGSLEGSHLARSNRVHKCTRRRRSESRRAWRHRIGGFAIFAHPQEAMALLRFSLMMSLRPSAKLLHTGTQSTGAVRFSVDRGANTSTQRSGSPPVSLADLLTLRGKRTRGLEGLFAGGTFRINA
jgi:hypothetical protein